MTMPPRILLLPQEEIARKAPLNSNYQQELFAHELRKTIPETFLLDLGKCQVLPNGFLLKGWSCLLRSETFWVPPTGRKALKDLARSVFATLKSTQKISLKESVLYLCDQASNNYFHWITDVLPKLEVLQQVKGKEFVRELTLIVPAMADFAYLRPSLEPFQLKTIKVLNNHERVVFSKLSYVTSVAPTGNYRPTVMKTLRSRFLTHFDIQGTSTQRLFISRQKAPRRKIIHEEALIPVLQKHGFQSVVLEDFTFAEQVRLVASAQIIVVLHGAGLTNMMWMAPKTKVLEIRFQGDSHNNCYFALASALDLDYFYVLAGKTNQEEEVYQANARLDPDSLEDALLKLLSTTKVF